MKKIIIIKFIVSLLLFGFSGCASSWKQTNQDNLDKRMLNNALNECHFEKQRKLSHLYYSSSHGDNTVENERMKKEGDKVYRDALLCMKNKGFTK